MLPHAGQGAAQALEDAVTLAHVLENTRDLESGLRRYEQIRFERTRDVALTARRNAALASVRHPMGCWLRDRVLSLVPGSLVAKSYLAFALPPELS
jgi:2-polyprenyl-6-methoxyphenol hydroxylase-like FAD-dependent oxidoreductase